MIQKVVIQFDLLSFNEIKYAMSVLGKQISTMREVTDQLIIIKSDLAKEYLKFEQEYQTLVHAVFDISHRQDIESLSRGSIPTQGEANRLVLNYLYWRLNQVDCYSQCPWLISAFGKKHITIIIEPVILTGIQLWNNRHFY